MIKLKPILKSPQLWGLLLLFFVACQSAPKPLSTEVAESDTLKTVDLFAPQAYFHISDTVRLGGYFDFLETIIPLIDSQTPFPLTEHVLIAYNDWVVDTLAHTDYYWQMARGNFVYDPQQMVIFKPGDSLAIPSVFAALKLADRFSQTLLDLNIPSFELRIMVRDTVKHTFKVRVGQTGKRYMEMAGREVNMRTVPGEGTIVRINKQARFVNPKDNREYKVTRRDDKNVTLLPTAIPWIEPGLNGTRYGQLIHPTTNPNTLGRSYSNGCVGVGEGDMWRIYYHAPLGTSVRFRYDLAERDEHGHLFTYKDIYPGFKAKLDTTGAIKIDGWNPEDENCCRCGY